MQYSNSVFLTMFLSKSKNVFDPCWNEAFQNFCKYFKVKFCFQEGYDKEHPTIVNFWSVFHSLKDEDKKKFLKFLTGADRVPILGLKSLNIVIQKVNDENYLPVAHTW